MMGRETSHWRKIHASYPSLIFSFIAKSVAETHKVVTLVVLWVASVWPVMILLVAVVVVEVELRVVAIVVILVAVSVIVVKLIEVLKVNVMGKVLLKGLKKQRAN